MQPSDPGFGGTTFTGANLPSTTALIVNTPRAVFRIRAFRTGPFSPFRSK